MQKPDYCSGCPFTKHSTGFCPDTVKPNSLITIMAKMPGKEDIIKGGPMTGPMGWYAFKNLIGPTGLTREDVSIGNVIRCYPNNKGEFPTGKLGKQAVEYCRHWDRESGIFNKECQVVGTTFNPAALMRSPQQTVFLKRAFKRAKQFANEGLRPLLLLGEEARGVFMPHLSGPMKKWQGHWEEYKSGTDSK